MAIGLMSIIGAGLAAGSSAFNAIKQSKLAQEDREARMKERAREANWYERNYGESMLEANNRALTKMYDNIKSVVDRAKGSAAIAGGSDHDAVKAGVQKSTGEVMSAIAARNEAKQDKLDAQHQANLREFARQDSAANLQQRQNVATAAAQGVNLGGSMIAADQYSDALKSQTPTTSGKSSTNTGLLGTGTWSDGMGGTQYRYNPSTGEMEFRSKSTWNF